MSNKIKALFFDLDGTLFDTYEADFLAYRDAIAKITGITITKKEFVKTNGKEARDKVAYLVPDFPIEHIGEIRQAKKTAYTKYLDMTNPNEPLISFARDMANSHIIGLVTTAKKANAEAVLRYYDLLELFTIVVYGDDITEPKPNPQPYLLALEKAGVRAEESLAFEDSETGVQSAHSAGIRTIHISKFQ